MREPPALSTRQIQVLRESLAALMTRSDELAAAFYAHLFRLDPSLRLLFRRNMTRQRHKWVAALDEIFGEAHNAEGIIRAARYLGSRHRQYGLQQEDYRLAGEALLLALEQLLLTDFTPELRDAWTASYNYLTYYMQHAAADETRQPAGL